MRVLIVDDHPMVRAGLRKYLDTTDDLEVVGEAHDGSEAVAACARLHPDVVLMDMVMPGMDGPEATARIKAASPEVQVVAVTSYAQDDLVQRALDAGAIGYLLKDARPEAVLQAVRDAGEGRGSVDSAALRAMMRRSRDPVGRDLTSREREALSLLARGMSNEEIAARLDITTGTVSLHVSSILTKLQAPNRTAAAIIAMEHGLADTPPR